MSNFNEEIYKELADLKLEGRLIPINSKDKGTKEDFIRLENKIFVRTEENRVMMEKSLIYAERGLPTGINICSQEKAKSLILKRK